MSGLRILIVDDNPESAELLLSEIRRGGIEHLATRVVDMDSLRSRFAEGGWDLAVISDSVATCPAANALEIRNRFAADVPLIVIVSDEATAATLLRRGASDCISRANLSRLVPRIEGELRERRRIEESLRSSEERYRLMFEANPQPMLLYDLETLDFLAINAIGEQVFGYRREDLLKRKAFELLAVEEHDRLRDVLSESEASPSRPALWRVRRADGKMVDVEACGSNVRYGDRPARLVLAVDVTDRVRAEAELRRTATLLKAVADGTSDAVFVKDLEGRYLLANPATAEFIGLPAEEILGKVDNDFFDPADAAVIRENDLRVMQCGEAVTRTERLHSTDGIRSCLATKAPYFDAERNVIGLIGISRDITELLQAEEALRLRDRAIGMAPHGIVITDPNSPDNPIVYASPGFERLTGFSQAEVIGRNCRFLQGPETSRQTVAEVRWAISNAMPIRVELLNYRKDGSSFWNELSISPVRDEQRNLTHIVGVQSDATSRRKMESQFRQSHKLEAIGQLAGGVAHDFNNLLTVISGYSEILIAELEPDHRLLPLVREIHRCGERSAALTNQLLVFSRKQVIDPQVLNLNEVVIGTEKLLRRVIGEDIRLETRLENLGGQVRADTGQLEQVLVNLAVNARDAMPRGGTLTITTTECERTATDVAPFIGVRPGRFLVLSVKDTGCGMTEAVKSRIFEPFFTTKDVGKGTGLGLSMIHGIVEQSGGYIDVQSDLGSGTTFKIFLPCVARPAVEITRQTPAQPICKGTETVLLAEDEDSVRSLTKLVLTGCGYQVLEAANGHEALEVAQQHSGTIDLLLSDVVMPGMGGWELSERLRKDCPSILVLFVSGYTDDAIVRHGVLEEQVPFLPKPFSPRALAFKVRQVLDSRGSSVAASTPMP